MSNDNSEFCIRAPHFYFGNLSWTQKVWNVVWKLFVAVAIALLIVYLAKGKTFSNFGWTGWLVVGLLVLLFWIIFMNANGSNVQNSVPFSTYPLPPHLGLNGVSLETRASY